jgi:molecular chaperone IbpA
MSRTDFSRLFDQLDALSIGFGPVFRDIQTFTTHYPPHNIYQDEDNIILEIAVAGFKKDEISIREEGGEITIQGVKPTESAKTNEEDNKGYTYRGIAARNFVKRFKLAEDYKTTDAKLEDGMLTLVFVKTQPKEVKYITIK